MGRKLKVDEVCDTLGVSRNHMNQLYYLAKTDSNAAPPRIRVSARRFLWDEDQLNEWLASRQEEPVSA